MIVNVKSRSLADTLALGSALGAVLRGGETIALASDLGGGKTALVKGLAVGMGSHDTVQSPTFTVSRIYGCSRGLELHHFDFYRLSNPGIMAGELADSLSDSKAVVIIEWADIVEEILPADVIRVTITTTGQTTREFSFAVPDSSEYVTTALRSFAEITQ